MSRHRKSSAWISRAVLACSSLFVAADVSAGPLACVQRAINWNNASRYNSVVYALSALHESGEGAYASGTLVNSSCTRAPYALGTVSCLVTLPGRARDALLLHPLSSNLNDFLRLSVDVIPSDNLAQVHLRQPNATYDFDPVCLGNLLIGNDQWGNHWTVAFNLKQNLPPR
jgi:hypothetical protein